MSVSAEISGNTSTNNLGGGVCVASGTFSMSGSARISGNTAGFGGGGVYVVSGTFSMSGSAEISGNITVGSIGGGGVFVVMGTFTKTGGTISGNTSTRPGKQLFVEQKYVNPTFYGKGRDAAIAAGQNVTVTSTNSTTPYTYTFAPVLTDPFWDSGTWE
jgi:hypothetical protein